MTDEEEQTEPVEEEIETYMDDDSEKDKLWKKAARIKKIAIAALVLAVFQIFMLFTTDSNHTLRWKVDSTITAISEIVVGFSLLKQSEKLKAMSLQDEPLPPNDPFGFKYHQMTAAVCTAMIIGIGLASPLPLNLPVLVITTVLNLIVAISVYFKNETIVNLRTRVLGGGAICVFLFWNSSKYPDLAFEIAMCSYLLFVLLTAPERKKWNYATISFAVLGGAIMAVGSASTPPKQSASTSVLAKYDTEISAIADSIDWKDAESIVSGIPRLDTIMMARKPYLDRFILKVECSLVSLSPQDTIRQADTLLLIKWHELYLRWLDYQQNEQEAIDTLNTMLTHQPIDSVALMIMREQFNQVFANFLKIDSAGEANRLIMMEAYKPVKGMRLPQPE